MLLQNGDNNDMVSTWNTLLCFVQEIISTGRFYDSLDFVFVSYLLFIYVYSKVYLPKLFCVDRVVITDLNFHSISASGSCYQSDEVSGANMGILVWQKK